MAKYSREKIEKAVKAKAYKWFEGAKDYDVNIVGVRNSATGDKVTNLFDDVITVSYKKGGEWVYHEWTITTDPGKKAQYEFHNVKGVARLKEGQYRGSHAIGLHQGKYKALRQVKAVTVYRDKDKDMQHDEVATDTGIFGINIHRSSATGTSVEVNNWSEGCQVFANVKDFEEFIKVCEEAVKIHGNSFTYTLIESADIA